MKKIFPLLALVLAVDLGTGCSLYAADNLPFVTDSIPTTGSPPIGHSLNDFLTAALSYSPRLRIAEERLNIGSARKRIANGQLLPQVTASANFSDNSRSVSGVSGTDNFTGQRFSFQLRQVLFNWQAFAARSQAYLFEDQMEAEYFVELATMLTDVSDKYFSVLQAEAALNSIRTELVAITNQVNQVQSLYDRQMAQITDLYEAQAQLAAVQSEQIDLESELDLSREALRAATGIIAGNLDYLEETTVIPEMQESAQYWINQAIQNNAEIKAGEFAFRAAQKKVSEQRGAYLPQVSLTIQELNTDLGFENSPVTESDNTFFGLDVTIPLFAGGSNRAAVSESISQQNVVANELRQVQLEVAEKTQIAYLRVKSSQSRVQAARKLLESTTLSATAMQRGFELGQVNSVDALNALRDQFQAQRDLQTQRYEHLKSLLNLKRESGLLSPQDLIDIGTWLQTTQN
ncbi:MAG: TolC family protein [Pseudomonadales bacterium]|nr:TolC family protein [Pseudomonadales bacterium]